IPLLAHRIGRGIAMLLRLAENGFPRGEVLELLRDGFKSRRATDIDDLDFATRKARIAGGSSAELVTFSKRRPLDDYAAIVAVLDALSQRELTGERPTLSAIVATDVMSFRGRAFDHLFVVRMQDDHFPQRRNDDPLVPDHDRKLLGMREIGDGREEERLLFEL